MIISKEKEKKDPKLNLRIKDSLLKQMKLKSIWLNTQTRLYDFSLKLDNKVIKIIIILFKLFHRTEYMLPVWTHPFRALCWLSNPRIEPKPFCCFVLFCNSKCNVPLKWSHLCEQSLHTANTLVCACLLKLHSAECSRRLWSTPRTPHFLWSWTSC